MANVAAGSSVSSGENVVQGVMNVSKEDQQKINQFAKLNARFEDVKEEISSKTNELQNFDDAMSEAEVKVLEDAGDKLHLQVGDIMINLDPDQTQQWLEDKISILKKSIVDLNAKKEKIVEEMTGLKSHLYARFGNNIHLESGP